MRILPIGRADGDLPFVIAAVWQPPVAFQRVAQVFGGPEEVGTLQCAACVSEREQHERLIVKVGARIEDAAFMIEAMNIEPVGAPSAFDEKVDVGVDHLSPRTDPAQPSEFAVRKDMASLNKQAMRTDVFLAVDR